MNLNISVIGTGYVGLTTGLCLSKIGHIVTCIDVSKEKIDSLKSGILPIYEPGLENLLLDGIENKSVNFSTEYDSINNSDVVIIAVGTPVNETDNSADLSYLYDVVNRLNDIKVNSKKLVILRSTVPVGTCDNISSLLDKDKYELVFNPEFLREGSALNDFLNPDRIIFGVENDDNNLLIEKIYNSINSPIIFIGYKAAELVKYASNSYLAMRIAFANEIAKFSDVIGCDSMQVLHGIGLDKRIGSNYFAPGPGFGGSCFPKDLLSMQHQIKSNNVDLPIIESIFKSNEEHKNYLANKVQKIIGSRSVAILGITFKNNTDDLRYSPAIDIALKLGLYNAQNKVYDPAYAGKMVNINDIDVKIEDSILDAISNAEVIIIMTEWDEFKKMHENFGEELKNKLVIDLRNLYSSEIIKENKIKYFGIGRSYKNI